MIKVGPHRALKLIAPGKLTFAERVVAWQLKTESAAARGEYSGAKRHGQSTLGGFAKEFSTPKPSRGRKHLDDDDD